MIRMASYAPSNPVARFEPGRALVLGGVNDADADLAAGRPSSTGPIQFVMQRKAMVGITQRAEGTWSRSPVDVVEPLLWLLAAGVLATASVRCWSSASSGGGHTWWPWAPWGRCPSCCSGNRRSPWVPWWMACSSGR